MKLGILHLDLMIDGANSLKAKRMVLKSFKDRLSNSFNVSVAEVDNNDKWQRVSIAVAMVSNNGAHLDGALSKVIQFTDRFHGITLLDHETEMI